MSVTNGLTIETEKSTRTRNSAQKTPSKPNVALKPLKQLAFKRRRAAFESAKPHEDSSYKHSPISKVQQ